MAEISKRGPPRKSRRARLPIASAQPHSEFLISEANWERLQAVYPALVDDDREPIIGIVDRYLEWEEFERNAPFFDDAMDWLKRVRKAAAAFWNITIDGAKPGAGEATSFARSELQHNLLHPALKYEDQSKWHNVVSIMGDVVCAFDLTMKNLESERDAGFVEGASWESMIRALAKFVRAKGSRVSAAHGVDKSASPKTSSFVAFVREIQNMLPVECRRHMASDAALAGAISIALGKETKPKRSRAKSKAPPSNGGMSRKALGRFGSVRKSDCKRL